VTHIILAEGLNDIAFPGARVGGTEFAAAADAPTLHDLMGAYRQLVARAHMRGIKIIGATLTPFEGVDIEGFHSPSKEATRQAVNAWIRTAGVFDGTVDFDAVLRDPDHPARLLARFASKDQLHPNDDGYQAMANAIDLALLR
jgi:lysophospholipase L1-like esterase